MIGINFLSDASLRNLIIRGQFQLSYSFLALSCLLIVVFTTARQIIDKRVY